MDTVEELDGTYFYAGRANLVAQKRERKRPETDCAVSGRI